MERLQRRRQRLLQHRDHRLVRARRQVQDARDRVAAVDRVAFFVADAVAIGGDIVEEGHALRVRQSRSLDAPALSALTAQERYLQLRQALEILCARIVDRKADGDPRDRQGCQDRDDHELVELPANEHSRERLLVLLRLRDEIRKGKVLVDGNTERVAENPVVEADEHHHRGVDPLAVVHEHRADGLPVARRYHLAKRVVGRHQARALNGAPRVLLEEAIEDPRSGDQRFADGLARRGGADLIDEVETARLDNEHQREKKGQDPALQAAHRNGADCFHVSAGMAEVSCVCARWTAPRRATRGRRDRVFEINANGARQIMLLRENA